MGRPLHSDPATASDLRLGRPKSSRRGKKVSEYHSELEIALIWWRPVRPQIWAWTAKGLAPGDQQKTDSEYKYQAEVLWIRWEAPAASDFRLGLPTVPGE